jgi:HAD superfamily hydrolase (TIGR01459 family)
MFGMDNIKICKGISDISDSYSGFIIDQWGTLHDGKTLFPEAVETLKNLKSRGKQIILLSNSGKRNNADQSRLEAMGLSSDYYDHIVTSSEVTRHKLKAKDDDFFLKMGSDYFLLNRHGDTKIVDNIDDLNRVDDIDQASFILLTGSDAPEKTFENYYDGILKKASRRSLKMVCANPEKHITLNRRNYIGGGAIARRYEQFGGVVHYIGKPYPLVYNHCFSLFENIYPSQVCVIGDSLATDIQGATNLDIDCALIANGVHKGSFSKVTSKADIQKMLKILGKNFGCEPTYFIPKFHWGDDLPDRKNKRKGE